MAQDVVKTDDRCGDGPLAHEGRFDSTAETPGRATPCSNAQVAQCGWLPPFAVRLGSAPLNRSGATGWSKLSPRDRMVAVLMLAAMIALPAIYWSLATASALVAHLGLLIAGVVLWRALMVGRRR